MDINQIRKDTPGTTNLIHLNNAGASLCPVQVTSAIRDYISEEEFTGGYELADKKREELDTFYDYAAQLLHCKKNNIAFTTNATDSYNRHYQLYHSNKEMSFYLPKMITHPILLPSFHCRRDSG